MQNLPHPGPVIEIKQSSGSVLFRCANGWASVTRTDRATIRVWIEPAHVAEQDHPFSYACNYGEPVDFDLVEQDADRIRLHAGPMCAEIGTNPFRVSFLDTAGHVLQKDAPGMGLRRRGEEFALFKKLEPGDRFIGLGAKTGPLDKSGRVYQNWNTDAFGYGEDSDPLYTSFPFFIGIREDRPFGFFLDNTYRTTFRFGASDKRHYSIEAAGGPVCYYFFYTGDVGGILQQYTSLTGRAHLPPRWALGYQQCRYSYYPDKELLRLAHTFRERNIPADVLYLDIHYMDAYKVFTWDPQRFPDPEQMLADLRDLGFRVVAILDPGIRTEPGYRPYETGIKGDHFVRYADGVPYEGDVWPGACHFPDFTSATTRNWWAGQVAGLRTQGISGLWTDMNEPAVWGQSFPDWTRFDLDGRCGTHHEAHNVYGMQMARATYEGSLAEAPEERPFVLTRAAYAGVQRYAAVWTGDNSSSPEHLSLSVRMTTGLGMAGVPFAGSDIGGFIGEADPALFMRWIATAAFLPLFRTHTMINSRSAEPWSFGEEVAEVAAAYIRLRYRMLPLWTSLFREYELTGIPPCRSLAIEYYRDKMTYDPRFRDQFMVGAALLVCPVMPGERFKEIWLPEGAWYDLYTGKRMDGGVVHILKLHPHTIPVFARGGSILPQTEQINHTGQQTRLLELHLFNLEEDAAWTSFDEDGLSFAYKTEAGHCSQRFFFNNVEKKLTVTKPSGGYQPPYEKLRIYLHNAPADLKPLIVSEMQSLQKTDYRFVDRVSDYDPFGRAPEEDQTIFGSYFLEIQYPNDEYEIQFIID